MTCKLTPHPFGFPFLPTHKLKSSHAFLSSKYTHSLRIINFRHTLGTETTTIFVVVAVVLSMTTPQSSCNENGCEKQILESSEFKKTQQSSNDEETPSILKLPSSDMEKDLQPKESDITEKVITFTGTAEATLPVQEPSLVLTPLMEKKIRTASPVNMEGQTSHLVLQAGGGGVEDTGRERLKRHRVEMAGRVWIPDMWGQEGLLKDWIDCSSFDASLMNGNIMLARAALAQEGRRATSTRIRIENSC